MARPKKNGAANGAAASDKPDDKAKPNARPEDDAECYLEAKELKRHIAQLSQKLSATYARYENMGVDTQSVKDCLKLEKDSDPAGRLKRIQRLAAILDIVPTETEKDGQITIMPGLTVAGVDAATKEKIAIANAYNDGYNTGLVGGSDTNNKYKPGSELRVKWSLGHIDGQAQRAIRKPGSENVKEASTVKGRRGRASTSEAAPETAPVPATDEKPNADVIAKGVEAELAEAGAAVH